MSTRPVFSRAPLAGALALGLLAAAAGAQASTGYLTVGAATVGEGFPFSGAGYPYGGNYVGTGPYQQLYSAAAFSGPQQIASLAFESTDGIAGTISYNLTVDLSTTSTSLTGLSGNFASNRGADFTQVFNGPLTATLSGTGQFDLVLPLTTPFAYDPSKGNLLLDVSINPYTTKPYQSFSFAGASPFTTGPLAPDPNVTQTSRVYINGNYPPGTTFPSATVQAGGGLLTRFGVLQTPAVPETSPLALLALGLAGLCLAARLRQPQSR